MWLVLWIDDHPITSKVGHPIEVVGSHCHLLVRNMEGMCVSHYLPTKDCIRMALAWLSNRRWRMDFAVEEEWAWSLLHAPRLLCHWLRPYTMKQHGWWFPYLRMESRFTKKDEKRNLESQSDGKTSGKGIQIIKQGFLSANMCTRVCVCVHRDSTFIRSLDHASFWTEEYGWVCMNIDIEVSMRTHEYKPHM